MLRKINKTREAAEKVRKVKEENLDRFNKKMKAMETDNQERERLKEAIKNKKEYHSNIISKNKDLILKRVTKVSEQVR